MVAKEAAAELHLLEWQMGIIDHYLAPVQVQVRSAEAEVEEGDNRQGSIWIYYPKAKILVQGRKPQMRSVRPWRLSRRGRCRMSWLG